MFRWAIAAALFAGPAQAGEWEAVSSDDGIEVWQRAVPGTSLVEFKSRVVIPAGIVEVAAVLRDQERKCEWMYGCAENRAVRYGSATGMSVYYQVKSPLFFVQNRDALFHVALSIAPERRELLVSFQAGVDPLAPPRDGVVRMPRAEGRWRLRQLGPRATELVYQVFADPGGDLPSFMVNWAARDIPARTLEGLRARVGSPIYQEHVDRLLGSIDWTGFDVGEGPSLAPPAAVSGP